MKVIYTHKYIQWNKYRIFCRDFTTMSQRNTFNLLIKSKTVSTSNHKTGWKFGVGAVGALSKFRGVEWREQWSYTRHQPELTSCLVQIMRPCPPTVWLASAAPSLVMRITLLKSLRAVGGHSLVANQFKTLLEAEHWKLMVSDIWCIHRDTQGSTNTGILKIYFSSTSLII